MLIMIDGQAELVSSSFTLSRTIWLSLLCNWWSNAYPLKRSADKVNWPLQKYQHTFHHPFPMRKISITFRTRQKKHRNSNNALMDCSRSFNNCTLYCYCYWNKTNDIFHYIIRSFFFHFIRYITILTVLLHYCVIRSLFLISNGHCSRDYHRDFFQDD